MLNRFGKICRYARVEIVQFSQILAAHYAVVGHKPALGIAAASFCGRSAAEGEKDKADSPAQGTRRNAHKALYKKNPACGPDFLRTK